MVDQMKAEAVVSSPRQGKAEMLPGRGKAEAAKKLPQGCLKARQCLEDYITEFK